MPALTAFRGQKLELKELGNSDEHEWERVKVEDYITQGKEPGQIKTELPSNACPIEGDFGC